MRIHLHRFFEFLSELIVSPGWKVMALALTVCAMPFLIGITTVTPAHFATSLHQLLARSPHDVRVFGYANAASLSVNEKNDPKVVLVGASSMQAAYDSQRIEEEVFRQTGIEVSVYNLAVDTQTIMEFIGMVEHIPEGSSGVLFLKVSPIAMTKDYSAESLHQLLQTRGRFSLITPMLKNELETLGIRSTPMTGNFFLDNAVFLCARYKNVILNLLRNERHKAEHVYMNRQNVDQKKLDLRGQGIRESLNLYSRNKETNFQYIRDIVSYVRQRTRMEIVLVEQLYNPYLTQHYIDAALFSQYQNDITRLANTLNVVYLDLPSLLQLTTDDFYDWTHVNTHHAVTTASQQLVKSTIDVFQTGNNHE